MGQLPEPLLWSSSTPADLLIGRILEEAPTLSYQWPQIGKPAFRPRHDVITRPAILVVLEMI